MNDTLSMAALHHSVFMFERKHLSHTGRDGSVFTDRVSNVGYQFIEAAENIACCPNNAGAAFALWQNSPPHYQNMTNPVFADIGLALAPNRDAPGDVYWTAIFAAPLQADNIVY